MGKPSEETYVHPDGRERKITNAVDRVQAVYDGWKLKTEAKKPSTPPASAAKTEQKTEGEK